MRSYRVLVLSFFLGIGALGCTQNCPEVAVLPAPRIDPQEPKPSGPQLPECNVVPMASSGPVVIMCGSPETPDKPDKPDKPEPDRSKFIEADRVMTEKVISELEKSSSPDKDKHIAAMRQHHADCRSGAAKCVGEP